MHPVLSSCQFLLSVVRALIAGVRGRDGLGLARPAFASRAVAGRLASGLASVEAFLRRVLLVMALELEPTLIDRRGPMRRPHGRKAKQGVKAAPRFSVLRNRVPPLTAQVLSKLAQRTRVQGYHLGSTPQPVAMARLYHRLDTLSAIANAPLARARRLAFHLARHREGPILAPNTDRRPPSTWSVEARASFTALAHEIITRSKARPPPLPPQRRSWPTVTLLP